MTLQQIVKSWGINLPEDEREDFYLPEFLLQNNTSKCYFVDFFPIAISKNYAYKHSQVERKVYYLTCDRMYNAILKLWVYDDLYFESDLLYSKSLFKKSYSRRRLLRRMNTNCVEKEDDLRMLLQLSRENIIDVTFAFEKLHVVIVPLWSNFFLFVEDESMLPLIKEIVSTEGLCMRNASTT